MHTYDSDAFIASVLRNLPSPEASGAKTPEGKYITSQNAVKHGLRLKFGRPFPCKRKCFYKDICQWHEMIFSENTDMYAGACPYEVVVQTKLEETALNDFPDASDALRREYVMYTLLINRCNRYISINPEIRGTFKGYNYANVIKDLYVRKWMKAFVQLQNYSNDESE